MSKIISQLRQLVVVAGLLGVAFLCQPGRAQGTGPIGADSAHKSHRNEACDPGYKWVERTIQVPTMVTERRIIQIKECRAEVHERTVMVPKMIPETRQVRDVYTVMVPHTEIRTERYQECMPVWRDVERNVTVQVPTQELRKDTRRVCRQVEVQEMQSVTRDRGEWADVLVEANPCCNTVAGCRLGHRWLQACGGCGVCRSCRSIWLECYDAGCAPAVIPQTQRVWKPNLVTEQVPVVVCRDEIVEEPYEYAITVYHPETRTQTVRVCDPVRQEKQREVEVTVCLPQRREALRNISTFRTVSEPQVQRYCVQVLHVVDKEIEVQVCRMVNKTIVCRVPVSCATDNRE